MAFRITSAFLLLLALTIVGCGGKPVGKVAGKVTHKGAPVSDGSIIFQNGDGTVAMSSNLGPDGSYTVTSADRAGLPPGDYKVAISPSKIGSGEAPLAIAPGQEAPAKPTIPVKYHSVDTTDLKASVKAGDNAPFNFDLVD